MNRKGNRKRSTGGFTLVEVVVAITILTLFVIPMLSAFNASFRLNAQTQRRMQARLRVTNKLEELMAEGYNSTRNYDDDEELTVDKLPDGKIKVSDKKEGIEITTYIHTADNSDGGDT